MSAPGRTPRWDEVERFCQIDGWEPDGSTDHSFWSKTLPSGERLETHASFSGSKTMSQGRFAAILRDQLRVSRRELWEALRTEKPVSRPSTDPPEEPRSLPGWVAYGLLAQGVRLDEIEALTPEEAERLLRELWAKPR